ncbi:Gfo/Idh/MocA family oxidoreductase [Acrocarpospora sp. B8E8]|uniref:Gfo/Idh/MocA family protein n=1 Tax=Acrocarpospora sp. B8E8 TaxID=3153572 RepID=UPI00325DE15E
MTDLRVGVVGHGFMGRAHAHAWRSVGHFFDLPLRPRLSVLCGRSPAVGAAAVRLGFPAWETDWRCLVERDDVDLVDICTPGDTHAPIAIAALRAGKHVLCEKPLANSVAEAEAMVRAARDAPGLAMAGFNFRRLPSVEFARELVAKRAGEIRHVRAAYLNGSLGSVIFDLGSPNEVSFLNTTDPPAERGFRRIRVAHPAWWYSHAIGYEHTFTHQARHLVEAIGSGLRPTPSFEDGLRVQRVLDAVSTSSGDWRHVLTPGVDGC